MRGPFIHRKDQAVSGGAAVRTYLAELRSIVAAVEASNDLAFGATGQRMREAVDALDRATTWLLSKIDREPQTALAGATPYLRLFATAPAAACWRRTRSPRSASAVRPMPSVATARFFATHLANAGPCLTTTVIEGANAVAVDTETIG